MQKQVPRRHSQVVWRMQEPEEGMRRQTNGGNDHTDYDRGCTDNFIPDGSFHCIVSLTLSDIDFLPLDLTSLDLLSVYLLRFDFLPPNLRGQCAPAALRSRELETEDLESKKPSSWDIGIIAFGPNSCQESSVQGSSGHLNWFRWVDMQDSSD